MSTPTTLRSLIWVPILAFIVLYGLMLTFMWRPIEQDVTASVKDVLSTQGYDWVDVKLYNRGRDVLISGVAPTELELRQAEELVASLDKVRVVDSEFTLGQPVALESKAVLPPLAELFSDSGRVYLKGELPSQEAIDALISQTQERYGKDNVTHELTINDTRLPLENVTTLFDVMDKAEGPTTISIADNVMVVKGEVKNEDTQVIILSTLSQLLGVDTQIENQLVIAEPPQEEVFLAAEAPIEDVVEEAVAEAEAEKEAVAEVPQEQVDAAQCGKIFTAFLSENQIHFASGKAKVKPASYGLLTNLAEVASKCPEVSFEVAGHTDSAGDEGFNQTLSQARAQAVISLLEEKGVDVARMKPAGYGSKKPVASNGTRQGRSANRRIEFTVKQ